jgi:hypothetical protein
VGLNLGTAPYISHLLACKTKRCHPIPVKEQEAFAKADKGEVLRRNPGAITEESDKQTFLVALDVRHGHHHLCNLPPPPPTLLYKYTGFMQNILMETY